jgi:hypothetical protein
MKPNQRDNEKFLSKEGRCVVVSRLIGRGPPLREVTPPDQSGNYETSRSYLCNEEGLSGCAGLCSCQ